MNHHPEQLPSTAEIALDLPVFDTYHYLIPDHLRQRVSVGMRVLVPAGRSRRITGYVVAESPPPLGIELKEIEDVLDDQPLFDRKMLHLFQFLARYLFSPLGEVIRGALPAGINIETRQKITLTETGIAVCNGGGGLVRGPKGKLLEALKPGEVITTIKLLEHVPEGRHYHIRELVRDGFCKLDQELTKPRIKTKTIRYVRIVEGVSLARRAALLRRAERQKQFYDLLQELGGEAAYAVLREKIDKADLALRALLKKGLIDLEEREEITDPFFAPLRSNTESAICELTPAQQLALDAILPGLHQRIFQPFLLHGVTGSGKTEIYLRIIQQTLQLGRQAIVLVPEIALTPQLVGVFRQRLGDQLAVLHSGLSERERFEHWWHIRRGDVPLVIGARSAIFAPFSDLGVIIVDEEQESSYKQEGRFPYHARNLALVRGKDNQATVVLGSATPAFESFNNAHNGKWKYLALPERIHAKPLPGIEIIDLRQIGQRVGGILSPQLKDHIEQNLKSGDQTILFLNRRGYHTSLLCTACGYAFRCLYCSVGLTFHQQQNALLCHYCGYAERLPQCCPQCQCPEIEYLGRGTEKIHEILHQIFPHARIDRMDRDTISGQRGQLEHLLQRFNRHEIDILLGTQMVAKGHDFPGVTLVGVLLADMGMNLPDFRSAERTFQLLVQVAGRAGRGQRPGRVVIQTFNPSHPSIQFVQQHDYIGFYESEITSRYDLGYPPFGWLIALRFDGRDPDIVRSVAEEIGQMAAALISQPPYSSVVFLGPAPAPIERIKSRFRWQMLFKSAHRTVLHAMIWQLMRTENLLQSRNQVKISIDPDPINML